MTNAVKVLVGFCLVTAVIAHAAPPSGSDYPSRPIRLIVPYPPGGAGDIVARPLAEAMGKLLKQTVVVENKVGASAVIGADAAARAAPDGYTLALLDSAALVINPVIYKKLPYDPKKDFTPIGMVARSPFMIVANPSLGVRNLPELVAAGKKRSDLNYSSAGNGSLSHLTTEWLKSATGMNLKHIPYKGAASFMAVVAGEAHAVAGSMLGLVPLVKDGRVVPIAVTSSERSPMMPDLPTVAESGVPGFDATNWFALVAPRGLSAAMVERLAKVMAFAANSPEMREVLVKNGAVPVGDGPIQLQREIDAGLKKWGEVARKSGAHLD